MKPKHAQPSHGRPFWARGCGFARHSRIVGGRERANPSCLDQLGGAASRGTIQGATAMATMGTRGAMGSARLRASRATNHPRRGV